MTQKLFGAGVNPQGLSPEPLRPTPLPSSIYHTPAKVEGGQNLMQLAQALKGLSSGLAKFAHRRAEEKEDPNSEQNKAFIDSLYTKTTEELNQMAAGPELDGVRGDALYALVGSKAADQFTQDWTVYYNTEFDQAQGNAQEELDARRMEIMASLPNDAARASFMKSSEGFYRRALQGDIERTVSNAVMNRNDGVLSQYRLIANEGLHAGREPKAIADEIMRAGALNRNFVALDGKSQNEVLWSLAEEYAEQGRPELVKELLNHDRGGVGALIRTGQYAVAGTKLIERAGAIKDDRDAKAGLDTVLDIDERVSSGSFTRDDASRVAREKPWLSQSWLANKVDESNRTRARALDEAAKIEQRRILHAQNSNARNTTLANAAQTLLTFRGASRLRDVDIPNKSGDGVETITVKEQLEFARTHIMRTIEEKIDADVAAGRIPEEARDEAVLGEQVRWAASSGVIPPEWQRTFDGMQITASEAQAYSENGMPTEVTQAAEMYRRIHAKNPALVRKLVTDDETQEFFETYRLSMESGRTPETAFKEAARVSAMSPQERTMAAVSRSNVLDAINDYGDWGDMEVGPTEQGTLMEMVQQNVRRRMPLDRAMEVAAERFKNEHVVVNGRAVRRSGRDFPEDFEEIVPELLKEYARQNAVADGIAAASETSAGGTFATGGAPARDIDVSDRLFVVPQGRGRWAIMDKETGLPVLSNSVITTRNIEDFRKSRNEASLVEDQSWRQTVERHTQNKTGGVLGAWVESLWNRANGVTAPTMTPAEARKLATDEAAKKQLEAYISTSGEKRGFRYVQDVDGTRGWINPKTREYFRAEVSEAGGTKSITWTGTGRRYRRGVITGVDGGFVLDRN